MLIAAAAALLVIAVALALPAAIRAYRIAWFHRRLGPGAWPLLVAVDLSRSRGGAPGRAVPGNEGTGGQPLERHGAATVASEGGEKMPRFQVKVRPR